MEWPGRTSWCLSPTPAELQAILNTIPFDLTFVDKDDTVRFRHHPQLDEPLACLVPAYRALSSPALRQTVGAAMTLSQLAANGGVPLGTLITGLRAAAGIPDAAPAQSQPSWVTAASRTTTLDARPMLAAGAHPVNEVMAGLGALGTGEVYEMLTPFVPAPLIDMARARGCEAFSMWDDDVVRTFFRLKA